MLLKKLKKNALAFLFSLFPKNSKKAYCESYSGRGYSDSPKAIAEELHKRGWKIVWAVKSMEESESLPSYVSAAVIGTAKELYHRGTAAVWIDNCRKWGRLFKRKSQLYVQTWHGFPLKRIEGDAESALAPEYVAAAKKDSQMADLFISDSKFLTEIYRRAFWYSGEVLECGFPRNDVLALSEPELAAKVRSALNIPDGKRVLLYAPTFRRDRGLEAYDVDYARVISALGSRFGGEWIILARLHPNVADKAGEMHLDPNTVINASAYPDIQELYLASDALLTDYSSVMFDFMNTGRPCFLYVNDLAAYKDNRNFTFDINRLPFPMAESNDELEKKITEYDEAAAGQKNNEFIREFGIIKAGSAAKKTADWIENRLGGVHSI